MTDMTENPYEIRRQEYRFRLASGGPSSRVWLLRNRHPRHTAHHAEQFLQLLYGAVLWADPSLLPDEAEITAAAEAKDLHAIDTLYLPLDRAALDLLHLRSWKDAVEPYITHVAHDRTMNRHHMHAVNSAYWHTSRRTYRDIDGYQTSQGFPYLGTRCLLETAIVRVTGGYPPESRVRLHDGRTAVIDSARWTGDGAPHHYLGRFPGDATEHTIPADQIDGPADS